MRANNVAPRALLVCFRMLNPCGLGELSAHEYFPIHLSDFLSNYLENI